MGVPNPAMLSQCWMVPGLAVLELVLELELELELELALALVLELELELELVLELVTWSRSHQSQRHQCVDWAGCPRCGTFASVLELSHRPFLRKAAPRRVMVTRMPRPLLRLPAWRQTRKQSLLLQSWRRPPPM